MYTCVQLVVIFAACAFADPSIKWPAVYQLTGTLKLPYAEITEPFAAWYDSNAKKSRVDYYGGIVSTIQDASKKSGGTYGKSFKISPVTTYSVVNEKRCFLVNGTKDAAVEIQTTLPDMTGFKKLGASAIMNSVDCDVYQKIEMKFGRKNTYTMWVDKDGQSPVRYEMMGYDSLLGSHYDKYIVDYGNVLNGTIDPKNFDIPSGLKCGNFPGPGSSATNRVSMNPMSEYMHQEDRHTAEAFNQFKKTHSKHYKHKDEEAQRVHVFRQNLRFIHSTNRASLGFTVAINHLTDKTDEERAVLRGKLKSNGKYNGGLPFPKEMYKVKDLPDQLDWRLYGAVNPVKDQAVCGSCWSFGTTGVLEGAMFMKTGKLVRLSQQQLIDCSWGEGNNACDGGEDFRAYKWIMKNKGITSEEQYGAYMGQNGQCQNKTSVFNIKGYVNVTSGDLQAMKIAMAKQGPISIAIDASVKAFSFYSNGVFYDSSCKNNPDGLDHAVLAVGYGVLNGIPYWLVKNSWSTYWGNDGYVLIAQKDNNCGVLTAPTYVI